MNRFTRLNYIQTLNPNVDYQTIYRLIWAFEFPWDFARSLEIALLKTFCVPSISGLLNKTQEFKHHTQKRYDDTALLIAEVVKWGYDSDRGAKAISRINYIHKHFNINNEDFLYVLSTFIYEPVRWNLRFGWRQFTEQEKQASFKFWEAVGKKMSIKNIPKTYQDFEKYSLNYENKHFVYAPSNRELAEVNLNLLLNWIPFQLKPVVKPFVYVLMDEKMLRAFGFSTPNLLSYFIVEKSLNLRSQLQKILLPRKKADFYTDHKLLSYSSGYQIEDLGPQKLLKKSIDNKK